MTGKDRPQGRLVAVELDPTSLAPGGTFIDDERAVAVRDLVAENHFSPGNSEGGTYRLLLSVADGKLVLDVSDENATPIVRHVLSLTPLRRVVKDYFLICDAYFAALKGAAPAQIEAIDIGRRGLHNEGAGILQQRLAGKISVDFATARRLFTLVCALHWKG